MIDIALLCGNEAEKYKKLLEKKDPSFNIEDTIKLYKQRKELQKQVEELQAEKNSLSKGPISDEKRARSIEIGSLLSNVEAEFKKIDHALNDIALNCPNFSAEEVPHGNKEENLVVKSWGNKPIFSFEFKNHVELNKKLNWFDFATGTAIAESGFVFYNEFGAKLIYALTNLLLRHNKKWGFTPVLPPYVVSETSLYNTGSLPKFRGDFYEFAQDGLSLTPTAEVCLTSANANKIFLEQELPLRQTAWTPCFRREAGGYGSTERGLIRIHQFEKVELYAITKASESMKELDRIVECAEEFLQKLGLCYQVSLLAGQDCSFGSTKTFDLEVWLPGQNRFYEVSSCSNCTDFQARRAKIRCKANESAKPELVHTLNGSSLALPRLIVAMMENFQQADGSVILPQIVRDEMDRLW